MQVYKTLKERESDYLCDYIILLLYIYKLVLYYIEKYTNKYIFKDIPYILIIQ